MKKSCCLILLALLSFQLYAQVLIYTEPEFPTADDDITVYFDASKGNGALAGYEGDIYAHTGVITDSSPTMTNWKYIVSYWDEKDPQVLMTPQGDDIYTLEFNIRDYYDIPMAEHVLELAFVFRDADGVLVGRETDDSDIFVAVFQPRQDSTIISEKFEIDIHPDEDETDIADVEIPERIDAKAEHETILNFNITPNPSAGDISIYYQTNTNEPIEISITEVSGQQIYSEVITSFPGIHSKSLEMDLEAGIYLVHLKLKDGINSQKLIIQK